MARTFITSDDLSPIVLTITWLLCIASVLSMVARGSAKLISTRSSKSDDYSSLSSLVISILSPRSALYFANLSIVHLVSQYCSVRRCHRANLKGAGQTCHRLGCCSDLRAANILYLSSVCLSELSVVLLVRNITPVPQDRRLLFGAGSITILWTITAVVVSAAECGSPTPWNYFSDHCIMRVSVWLFCLSRHCPEVAELDFRSSGGTASK